MQTKSDIEVKSLTTAEGETVVLPMTAADIASRLTAIDRDKELANAPELTVAEKLERSGLTLAELKSALGL